MSQRVRSLVTLISAIILALVSFGAWVLTHEWFNGLLTLAAFCAIFVNTWYLIGHWEDLP